MTDTKTDGPLPDGHYRTVAGSEMWISNGGLKSILEFDWLEEGGCIECRAEPYELNGRLIWYCDECGGGDSDLVAVK